MSLNYTYREVEMLQLFAKRAEVEEIEKLFKSAGLVHHVSDLLKEEKKRIKAKIKQCQKQVEEGR